MPEPQVAPQKRSSVAARWTSAAGTVATAAPAPADTDDNRRSQRQGSWLTKRRAAAAPSSSTTVPVTAPTAAPAPEASGPAPSRERRPSWLRRLSDRELEKDAGPSLAKTPSWRRRNGDGTADALAGARCSGSAPPPASSGRLQSPRNSWKAAVGNLGGIAGLRRAPDLQQKEKPDFGVGGVDKAGVARLAQAKATAQCRDPEDVWVEAVQRRLQDPFKLARARALIARIKVANGFPQRRRPSLRDNDIVARLEGVIANDPTVTEIVIDNDPRVAHLRRCQLLNFCEGLRTNLYLRRLIMTRVELDNEFLSALSAALEINFTLEYISLSNNAFTSDALVEFCQAMAENESVRAVDLACQMSPVMGTAEDGVLEAIRKNDYLRQFKIEFKNEQARKGLTEILKRNESMNKTISDMDMKILNYLEHEALRAEERYQHMQRELSMEHILDEHDWDYLYELNEIAKKFKHYDLDAASDNDDGQAANFSMSSPKKRSHPAGINVRFTSDGAFLTPEFIEAYLVYDEVSGGLTFAFQTQVKLFKRFQAGDADRLKISQMFADALLNHSRSKELTHINMANTGCGDEWFCHLCRRCLENPKLLPRLTAINLETNFLSEPGIIALSQCIASGTTWKYLQSIKLENQKHLISSRAEFALAKSLCVNRSIITMSLRVRNLWERDQINRFIVRNIDFLRQARLKHAVKSGANMERTRNKIETFFDKIAANDSSITEVELVADPLFLALSLEERLRAALSFAKNMHVKSVKMCHVGLDDEFAVVMAKSIKNNTSIERINFESNKISSDGIPALIGALGRNRSITEMQLRHQFKPMDSNAEDSLPGLLSSNSSCVKLGLDLRSLLAQSSIEKKLMENRELARKARLNANPEKATTPPRLRSAGAMQSRFRQIAANDPSIKEVELVGDKLFTAMGRHDRLEAAKSFATNAHVKNVKMCMLDLDDEFAEVLAESIKQNETIEKLILEQNDIRGTGIKAICRALGSNASIVECQMRHQKKAMDTASEDSIAELMGSNQTILKFGVTLRSSRAVLALENLLRKNRELQRKARHAIK